MKCNHYIIILLIILSTYFILTTKNKVIEGADCGGLTGSAASRCKTCIAKDFKKTDCKNQFY